MVIEDGEVQYIGEPEQTALRYYRLNFGRAGAQIGEPGLPPPDKPVALDVNARLVHAWLLDEAGERVANLEQDAPIILDVAVEAAQQLQDPIFVFHVRNADGLVVFGFTRTLREQLVEGQRVRFSGEIENRLVPGSYSIDCWIRQDRQTGDMALQPVLLTKFVVYGTAPRHGVVSMRADVEPSSEPAPDQ
jgi:hypothetical protein